MGEEEGEYLPVVKIGRIRKNDIREKAKIGGRERRKRNSN